MDKSGQGKHRPRSVCQDDTNLLDSSDSSEKSSQQFYIDLSNIPDPLPQKIEKKEDSEKRKNIFQFYVNFDNDEQQTQMKPVPDRFSTRNNSIVTETMNNFDDTFEQHEKTDCQPSKIINKHLACVVKRKKKCSINAEMKEEPGTSQSVIDNCSFPNMLDEARLIGQSQSKAVVDGMKNSCGCTEDLVTDIAVEAGGIKIRAHKFLLASRSPYFARIFESESAGNVIAFPSFSYGAVSFAIHFIYSGASSIPCTLSIGELISLAGELGLERLKDLIVTTLRKDCCHNFHEPCFGCPAGVLECFRLTAVYGLDDLHKECLSWITKHFTIVWRTITFASLPKELLEECYREHESKLTLDNFVDVIIGCGNYMSSSQCSAEWCVEVTHLCERLLNASAIFMAPRLVLALQKICPVVNHATPSTIRTLSNCVMSAIECASTDELCRSYIYLTEPKRKLNLSTSQTNSSILRPHSTAWRISCEHALVRAAPRVVVTDALKDLPPHLIKKLRKHASMTNSKQKNASPLKESKVNQLTPTRNSERLKSTFAPHSLVPVAKKAAAIKPTVEQNGKGEMQNTIKINSSVHVRTTKTQDERVKLNNQKKNLKPTVRTNSKTRPNDTYVNTKPRYLEPRVCKVSSRESSRNSSPIQQKSSQFATARLGHIATSQECLTTLQSIYDRLPPAISQDCLETSLHHCNGLVGPAISQDSLVTNSRPQTAERLTNSQTDSLNSNEYATYTKQRPMNSYDVVKVQGDNQLCQTARNNKFQSKMPVSKLQNVAYSSIFVRFTDTRKADDSVMNSTKSSTANIVMKKVEDRKTDNIRMECIGETESYHSAERALSPIMERSSTFSKDDPMFGG